MPAPYSAPVSEFLTHDADLIVGGLSQTAARANCDLDGKQLQAWRNEISVLKSSLCSDFAREWHLLLEYPIPRRGGRVDAVILADGLILVVEFKCGGRTYDRSARIQVEDYCLDLRDFHGECRRRLLVPFLVATEAQPTATPTGPPTDWVAPLWMSNAGRFESFLTQVVAAYSEWNRTRIDPSAWDNAPYAPTPTIIEAAMALYEGQNVREISRCHAGAENLTKTTEAVISAIQEARRDDRKIICFVTGVPGSGKTLAGLNIIHNRELHHGSLGVFLSGNGPLVKVLAEALARDHSRRTKQSIAESRRQVSTFVQNVHRFIDAHFEPQSVPPDRVVVFDEAQRAWSREQSLRKFNRERSEPEIMLDVMDRHEGWAVIVALIGNGQEINTGEAGLAEWGRALVGRFTHWQVRVSPFALREDPADALFPDRPEAVCVKEDDSLHLDVTLRSYKAQAVSEFVAHLLLHDADRAHSSLLLCEDYQICMTRDFEAARSWLRFHQRGSRRTGLVASSGGRRLRAHGLDVRTDLDVENWFLNPNSDVRSSYYLETPATEFGIQGLELDRTGVCWDIDLVPDGDDGWHVGSFKGTNWQVVRDPIRRRYVINKYRVLLTRAREGMVIWVPNGETSDCTRPPGKYDAIASYLRRCGVPEL